MGSVQPLVRSAVCGKPVVRFGKGRFLTRPGKPSERLLCLDCLVSVPLTLSVGSDRGQADRNAETTVLHRRLQLLLPLRFDACSSETASAAMVESSATAEFVFELEKTLTVDLPVPGIMSTCHRDAYDDLKKDPPGE